MWSACLSTEIHNLLKHGNLESVSTRIKPSCKIHTSTILCAKTQQCHHHTSKVTAAASDCNHSITKWICQHLLQCHGAIHTSCPACKTTFYCSTESSKSDDTCFSNSHSPSKNSCCFSSAIDPPSSAPVDSPAAATHESTHKQA